MRSLGNDLLRSAHLRLSLAFLLLALALVSAVVTRVWAVPTASWPGVSIVRKAGGLTQPTAHHSLSAAEVSDAIDAGRAMSVDKAVQYVLEGPAG